ncbi:MAG: hypothetical protein M3O25_04965 [Actinomycetota bacterium]|nr:hypothetical protein [Actinomycetota bacterium]
MPSHRETITVELPSEEALRACQRALPSLGWEHYEGGAERLLAVEDPTRLDCRTSPSRVEIELSPRDAGRTEISFNATAPGVGPIPGPARLVRQVRALKSRIGAESGPGVG